MFVEQKNDLTKLHWDLDAPEEAVVLVEGRAVENSYLGEFPVLLDHSLFEDGFLKFAQTQ